MRVVVVLMAGLLAGCPDHPPRFTDAAVPIDAGPDADVDAPAGRSTTSTVTGAVRSQSPNYKLYGTLQAGDQSGRSPSYQLRGNVTGATEEP